MNCHLTSGQEHTLARLEDMTQIYSRAFDSAKGYQEYTTENHEFKFIIGDLNFRIDMQDE